MTSTAITIGGFVPLTTIDFPNELAAVVFCQGCPWRCSYCQNHDLLSAQAPGKIAWEEIIRFLQRRTGLLDGVVFSGGEPTLQKGLSQCIKQVADMGFKAALHTAGCYPQRLANVLPLLNWVGIDVKTPFADYDYLTGARHSGEAVKESLLLLLASSVPYEVRITVHPDLLPPQQLLELTDTLCALGVRHVALQECIAANCQEKTLRKRRAPSPLKPELIQHIRQQFDTLAVRIT